MVAIAVTLWQLAHPWLLAHRPDPRRAPRAPDATAQTERHPLFADLTERHLFGVAAPAATAAPVAAEADIQINGILYSSKEEDSFAVLTVNGRSLAARTGTSLPTGATIVAIKQDRVVIDRSGKVESLVFEIKKADLNARFTPAQFAGASGAGMTMEETPGSAGVEPLTAEQPISAAVPGLPAGRPALVTPHFESLRQLRGPKAMARFHKVQPPELR